MDLSLRRKTALVAGSTGGIGKSVALELARMECRVFLIARNETSLKSVLAELKEISDIGHDYVVADYSQPDSVEAAGTEAVERAGAIHILINNTGGPPGGAIVDAEIDEFRHAFEMHLINNHILSGLVIPSMKQEGYGRIVNVISTSVKQPLPNLGVSNTVRGAVANWSKTMANELGRYGITVNNVLPGPTATSRLQSIAENKAKATGQKVDEVIDSMGKATPLNRVAQPEEVANAICFLCSPAASYMNGINVPVDGGRTGCL